jgi:membrane protein DedA with SNARE-associated domain
MFQQCALDSRKRRMNIDPGLGVLAYLLVFIAAAVEGEVVFVAASVLVGLGQLSGWGVMVAGALGGSMGDQFYFYACRGFAARWLGRIPWVAKRREWIVARVQKNQTGMVLACRFLPGLRVAIPVSCALANVNPLYFSVLSFISGFAWAAFVLELVIHWGPQALSLIGLKGGWAIAVPAFLVVAFGFWLSRSVGKQHNN